MRSWSLRRGAPGPSWREFTQQARNLGLEFAG
jgi:hypothetical protein